MTDAAKKELGKLDCYFFHVIWKCRYGDKCFMKHSHISDAKKALLKHPNDSGVTTPKAKRTAAPAVDKKEERPPRGRSTGAKGDKGGGKGKDDKDKKGKGEGKGEKGSKSRVNSPAPSNHSGKTDGGGKTNAEINKEFRLPGFCKEFQAGTCTREVVHKNPKGCSRGAHLSSDAYAKIKEKSKADIKKAKEKRNRSQSTPPANT